MDKIINHAVLSLDFWQDTVTYEGCAMPTGTIGCEVLNISAEAIETLTPPCDTMNRLLQGMNTGTVDLTLLPQVQARCQRHPLLHGCLRGRSPGCPIVTSGRNWRMFFCRVSEDAEIICSFLPAGAAALAPDRPAQQGGAADPA